MSIPSWIQQLIVAVVVIFLLVWGRGAARAPLLR